MTTKHTEGPWRWEFNATSRIVHLVGGKPQYDLTIMDFDRWGMHGAGIRLRDVAHNGMNLMFKLQERPDWIAPFDGREHHKHWCADVIHPDMRLIAAVPDLLAAVGQLLHLCGLIGAPDGPVLDHARAAYAKATGEQK